MVMTPPPPMHEMRCRRYRSSDRQAVTAVFESNVPSAFKPSERAAFASFLGKANTSGDCLFLVLEDHAGTVIGCGGMEKNGGEIHLCWGAVGKRWHRRGAGRFLMRVRLAMAGAAPEVQRVLMSTPSEAAPIWALEGFEAVSEERDGIAAGVHKTEMQLMLSPEKRRKLKHNLEEILEAGHLVERGLLS